MSGVRNSIAFRAVRRELRIRAMNDRLPPTIIVPGGANGSTGLPKGGDAFKEKKEPKIRASKLEYKTVDEIYDKDGYGRKIVESKKDVADDDDQFIDYIFVIRRRYGMKNAEFVAYVDIKSVELATIVRKVLKGVKATNLRGDKPSIALNLLFNCLPLLEKEAKEGLAPDSKDLQHVDLFLSFLQKHFASIRTTFTALLEAGEITFEYLWALFTPNALVYLVDSDCEQPKCLKYDLGERRTKISGEIFFCLQCRGFDHDGKVFGEVTSSILIPEFSGTKSITSLNAYPLEHHRDQDGTRMELVKRGRKFTALTEMEHRNYQGLAHIKRDGKTIKLTVDGRIVVDPISFRECNTNYDNPHVNPNDIEHHIRNYFVDSVGDPVNSSEHKVAKGRTPKDIAEEELLLCSPTVRGFSLSKRIWAEFAVDNIYDIAWNNLPFDSLVIPTKKKEILEALIQSHVSSTHQVGFDDFVEGKGQGLIILLHGSPGVGKTLTAEGIAEYQKRPLYRVCPGDLGIDAGQLEECFRRILDLVCRWNAILLFDEADVFLEQRSSHNLLLNTLVSVFLRELEYFQGVMILTTNRVTTFDEAIQSRIHLGIKYDALTKQARQQIWASFIRQSNSASKVGEAEVSKKQIEELSSKVVNGRQIKNSVRMGHALAISKGLPLRYEHITSAMDANEDFDNDYRGSGAVANGHSYL